MKNKTLMDRIRLVGTVLVTPFLVGAAAFGAWDVVDKIKNWQSMTPGGTLAAAYAGSQLIVELGMIGLMLLLIGSFWRRCFPRRRAWEDGAAKLPNPFTTSGKYAVWKLQRPSRRQALFGTLRIKKKVRSAAIRPKPEGP